MADEAGVKDVSDEDPDELDDLLQKARQAVDGSGTKEAGPSAGTAGQAAEAPEPYRPSEAEAEAETVQDVDAAGASEPVTDADPEVADEAPRKAKQTPTKPSKPSATPEETGETVQLGIPTLDRALMKGIPTGFSVLVVGNSGSGVELFAKQVASAGAEPTVYFSTEESGEEILETMARFGWTKELTIEDISSRYYELITKGKLAHDRRRRGDTSLSEILSAEETTEDDADVENFLSWTANRVLDLPDATRVIVNNLNFFFDEYDPEEVLSVLRALRTFNRHQGGMLLFTLSRGAVDEQLAQRIEAYMDVVIELEMSRMSSNFEHRMVVKKVKNHPEKARMFVYGITEEGITPEMVMRVT